MEYQKQSITDALEEAIMSANNRSAAANLFRNAKCLRDDFRIAKIISEVFSMLTHGFNKEKGILKLTNTSNKIGTIALQNIGIGYNDTDGKKRLSMGDFILTVFIELHYLRIEQEEHLMEHEYIEFGIKKKFKDNPYVLVQLPKFGEYEEVISHRAGLSSERYEPWKQATRMVDGASETLIKSTAKLNESHENKPFLKAVNFLEAVRWKINKQVSEVAIALKEEITNTMINLEDSKGNEVEFDTADIRREETNKHLKGIKLYRNKVIFQPHKGNSSRLAEVELKLNKERIRLDKLKSPSKIKEATEIVETLTKAHAEYNGMWSDKQFCLRTTSKAKRDEEIIKITDELNYHFYMSTYLDYRGRVYYKSPFFSFQSSDLARGNFLFSEGKPIGEEGRAAMFIHVASSYNQTYTVKDLTNTPWTEHDYVKQLNSDGLTDISVDKMSVADKEQWAWDNFDMFLDVAFDPLGTKDVWLGAENPWEFLSLCFEMAGIIANLDDLDNCISYMPVPIDGVNNGTQHLAAISRDFDAGKLVGLTSIKAPKDFYITIAKGIIEMNRDTEIGSKMKKMPMKKIRKGISKRGSMTRAYDAGKVKIGQIIYQDCYDEGYTSEYNITKRDSKQLGNDLVQVYDQTCQGPVEVKKYLQALVKYSIEELNNTRITWTNHAGFPAITEKMLVRPSRYDGIIAKKRICHAYQEFTEIPMISEHMSAIGANWVHSNDSAHMMIVINKLADMGLKSFGAIHDSFSVHACDIGVLTEVTKDVFIDMYNRDCFANMRWEIIGDDNGFDYDEPVPGELSLEGIRDSDFFFC